MTGPHVSPAERARMVQLYGLGLSVRDVGKVTGRTGVTVHYQLTKVAKIKLRPRVWSKPRRPDLDGAELKRRYEDDGLGVDALVALYDSDTSTILQRLHDAGTVMRPRGRPRKDGKPAG